MEHTKHIWRAVFILVAALIGAIVVRHFLIPASFGEHGFYRGDSLKDLMGLPLVHGSPTACATCHEKQFSAKKQGKHASLSCEPCHAPLASHVKDNVKIAAMPVNRTPALCAYCHAKLQGRRKTMPQIEIPEHLIAQGVMNPGDEIPEDACIVCHDVHSPVVEREPAAASVAGQKEATSVKGAEAAVAPLPAGSPESQTAPNSPPAAPEATAETAKTALEPAATPPAATDSAAAQPTPAESSTPLAQ